MRAVTPHTRAISSTTRRTSRIEAPAPPCSRGMVRPMKPARTRSFTLSQGYCSVASQPAARARKVPSASSRARRRRASCAAVSLKSIARSASPHPALSPGGRGRSYMNGVAEGGEGRLERGLGERGVSVDGVHDLLQRGLEGPPHRELVDQLGGLGTDDVHAQDLAGALVGHHLDEALGVAERDRLAAGGERELADRDLTAPPAPDLLRDD